MLRPAVVFSVGASDLLHLQLLADAPAAAAGDPRAEDDEGRVPGRSQSPLM